MIHYITSDGLGQPWVGNELRIVTQKGIPMVLHAMRAPKQLHFESQWAQQIARDTNVLYPLPIFGMIVSAFIAPFLFRSLWVTALSNALIGERENLRARIAVIAHFFVACHWALGLRNRQVSHIHSQWAYSSGTIGMYGAWLLGKSFSFTGHAADLFRDRVALRDKIRRAAFIVCISEFHRQFFLSEGARPDQLQLVYCGIDIDRMLPSERPRPDRPYTILSSGRLVEKKGFEYLIDACELLRRDGRVFQCVIAGSGPLEAALRSRVAQRRLENHVQITGQALLQEMIPSFMHSGDAYVLACVWAKDGDVDGLPQMTMEAMACGLPAITTRLVGNPDLVIHENTGLLVEPRDAKQLAAAIGTLMDDNAMASRLAAAGRAMILEKFDIQTCLDPLVQHYRSRIPKSII